jgi:hypothetical protein
MSCRTGQLCVPAALCHGFGYPPPSALPLRWRVAGIQKEREC